MNDHKERLLRLLSEHPDWGRTRLAREIGCSEKNIRTMRKQLRREGRVAITQAPVAPEVKEGCTFEDNGPVGSASSLSKDIRTVDELLAYAGVDRSVWEVERYTVNSWPMVMREPATTVKNDDGTPMVAINEKGGRSTLWTRDSKIPTREMLYQIKAQLRRKAPAIRAAESLLTDIKANAPILPEIKRPAKSTYKHKRSLEIDIMDPHLGLVCRPPEADGPWDLDIASGFIMEALEDLIDKTAPFGPFEEVFIPFGNDFTHCDTVFATTTAGTPQPESMSWHMVFGVAQRLAIAMVERLRKVAPVKVYEVPGNHSRSTDFALARVLEAYFHKDKDVTVDASSSPYKFHRAGVNLIGYEHGHSVSAIRLAALMANECRDIWHLTEYREWHLGDQHRKGASNPATFEEQGVSVEYVPGIVAPNEWHRLKAFSHQKRGAMAWVWDWNTGPIGKFQFNISQYNHKALAA